MSDLTNEDKIRIMALATEALGGENSTIVELYHAMIKAITDSDKDKPTGNERPFPV